MAPDLCSIQDFGVSRVLAFTNPKGTLVFSLQGHAARLYTYNVRSIPMLIPMLDQPTLQDETLQGKISSYSAVRLQICLRPYNVGWVSDTPCIILDIAAIYL